MEIFDEFIVVDEKAISELIFCKNCNGCKNTFRDVTQFASLEFMANYYDLKIKDIGNASSSNPPNSEPLAQIVRWKWDQNGAQQIIDTTTLNKGSELCYVIYANANASSFVIRILKKPEKKPDENSFPAPFSSLTDQDELTVKIGDKQIAVSAHWLMSVSPVISRMLSVEMKEKQQRMITLDELGVDMDQFMEFLEAITYLTMSGTFLPNPKKVFMLLKLADYFQVSALKSRCETHLINCVEIPLIDRFLLIERFGLDNFKNYFLHLDVNKLRAFFAANHEQFLPIISKEFFQNLTFRQLTFRQLTQKHSFRQLSQNLTFRQLTFRQLDIWPTDISPTFISPTQPKTFISPTQPKSDISPTDISPTNPKTFISPTQPKSDISPTDTSPTNPKTFISPTQPKSDISPTDISPT
ncbi:hypothetical protein niasHS_006321 [Heterodera schachtii]|uniref:BTB domain-containing protein n=1 Tax=Heterodera schachtii TaxID=97005 RepID=A0ABD2JWD4_HETSC